MVSGGYWLNVTGDGFGVEAGDVVSVEIGGEPSPEVRWLSSSLLMARVPPGSGSDLPVVMVRRDGARSNAGEFSYEVLDVLRVDPAYLLAGVGNVTLTVFGSNLGVSEADISSLSVGGYECVSVQLVSESEMSCSLRNVDDWSRSEVQVTTRFGRTYKFDGVFTGLSAPVVSYANPAVASSGEIITIVGRDFTRAGSEDPQRDISSVSIGGIGVTNYTVVDSQNIQAMVPTGIGSGLSIAVRSSTGRQSSVANVFAYTRPSVSQLEPTYIFGGEAGARIRLVVEHVGFVAGDLERVDVVDPALGEELLAPCNDSLSVDYASGVVECTIPSTSGLRLDPEEAYVRVVVGGQQSLSAVSVNGMQVIGAPTVDLVQPGEGPNEGGTPIVLTCDRIGDADDATALQEVLFNGVSVPFTRTGARTISISSVQGAGSGILIEVVTRGGLVSVPPGRFSYEIPEVSAVEPAYSLIGDFEADFVVRGSGFGSEAAHV